MTKLNLSDLAPQLIEKHGLDRREANYFVESFISILHEGLEADQQVKIRGLGTFKVVGVEARESVNIHTGERVVIDSHMKLSFTPDAAMKELVNKPFSQFETVILNDGVEFDDTPADAPAPADEDVPTAEPEAVVEPVVEPEPEPIAEPVAEPVEEDSAAAPLPSRGGEWLARQSSPKAQKIPSQNLLQSQSQ